VGRALLSPAEGFGAGAASLTFSSPFLCRRSPPALAVHHPLLPAREHPEV